MDVIEQDVRLIVEENLAWSKLQNSTVLITGATGMVGQYLVRALLALSGKDIKLKVIAVTRSKDKANKVFGDSKNEALQILVQDVAEPLKVDEDIGYVIHAASPASPSQFKDNPVGVINANVQGSFNMLELVRAKGSKYCFISTLEVYGKIEPIEGKEVYVTEDKFGAIDSLDLRSAYPESKRLAENLCVAYESQHEVDYKIARLTHTYGPGMDINDSRVQTEFIRHAIKGEDIILKTHGTMQRTYTYIADAVSGIFFILLKDSDQKVFNIANESARVSIKELAETIVQKANNKSKVIIDVTDNSQKMWSKNSGVYADCGKLKSLGWEPKNSVPKGITKTLEHYKQVT